METLEVRSKSFIIKWVDAPDNSVIHWQIKPIKKSINFLIYTYKDGEKPFQLELSSGVNAVVDNNFINGNGNNRIHHNLRKRSNTTLSTMSTNSAVSSSNLSLEQKLENARLIKHEMIGKCGGDELIKGEIRVEKGNIFAFVFDNTFSKTTAKKVLFTQYVHNENGGVINCNTAEISQELNHNIENSNSIENNRHFSLAAPTLSQRNSFAYDKKISTSSSSLSNHKYSPEITPTNIRFEIPELSTSKLEDDDTILRVKGGKYLQGFLLKRKRKRTGKNFNKRFFTLNFKYGILNYYLNDKSKHVRGNMFIKYVAITASQREKIIVLDSGLEIWTLKALSDEDFNVWVAAFNQIKQEGNKDILQFNRNHNHGSMETMLENNSQIELEAEQDEDENNKNFGVIPDEQLVKNLQTLQNKLESIKFNTSSLIENLENYSLTNSDQQPPPQSTTNIPPLSSSSAPSVTLSRKSSFWRRKKSMEGNTLRARNNSIDDSSSTFKPGINNNTTTAVVATNNFNPYASSRDIYKEIEEMGKMLQQIIDKQQLNLQLTKQISTKSTTANSIFSQEFFDANEFMNELNSGVLMLSDDSNDSSSVTNNKGIASINGKVPRTPLGVREDLLSSTTIEEVTSVISSSEEDDDDLKKIEPVKASSTIYEEGDLYPLSSIKTKVKRRNDVNPSTVSPPSIISFLRKNVGKDLSTIAMPVSANEPLTLLQKYSEIMEYCNLLDDAFNSDSNSGEKILKVATFAVSYLSSLRAKERNIRKPFNPLLGETFELVREDLGMRLITEKVSHRPPIMAIFAESENWTINYSPSPAQKFWGKNAEVINKGVLTLTFKKTGEVYQWSQPTTLLKNIIAGEKYTEPSGAITLTSSNGQRAIVDFKQNGVFSGRSESLTIRCFDADNVELNKIIKGTWTEQLLLKDLNTKEETLIWKAGNLVNNFDKKYGFTEFSASLNEITEIEKDKIAPTDSRLRPDLRSYENGSVDNAEALKLELEQKQRDRRNQGEVFKPKFFVKNGDDDSYKFISGKDSYWEKRKKQDWGDLV
ncbi:hypothetical protein PACTADRAFT_50601, partial [Pachysolen tannophilus NRRL Y-2460]